MPARRPGAWLLSTGLAWLALCPGRMVALAFGDLADNCTPRDDDHDDGTDYGPIDTAAYWDRTYRVQGAHGRSSYEWYGFSYKDLEGPLRAVLPKQAEKVLVVGSGDSNLSAALVDRGWDVTSIDFSEEVSRRMRERNPGLRFITMDARNMSFDSGHFSAIVDKGLSDCITTSEDLRRYAQELHRVLRVPGGALAVVSQRQLLEGYELFDHGWFCEPQQELLGDVFFENDEFHPPRPSPEVLAQIPYYLTVCRTA